MPILNTIVIELAISRITMIPITGKDKKIAQPIVPKGMRNGLCTAERNRVRVEKSCCTDTI